MLLREWGRGIRSTASEWEGERLAKVFIILLQLLDISFRHCISSKFDKRSKTLSRTTLLDYNIFLFAFRQRQQRRRWQSLERY